MQPATGCLHTATTCNVTRTARIGQKGFFGSGRAPRQYSSAGGPDGKLTENHAFKKGVRKTIQKETTAAATIQITPLLRGQR